MSMWQEADMESKIAEVLGEAHLTNPGGHHLGRPYVSSYQIAIALGRKYPDITDILDKEIGGRGIGKHNSVAQYLAGELSRKIKSDPVYFVEGAFLSNESVSSIHFKDAQDNDIGSSLVGTSFDMAIFRLRG